MKSFFNLFSSGVALNRNKHLSEHKKIETANVPEELIFPLSMHIGVEAALKVSVGQQVKIGTLLAASNGLISANIHSSVSGIVKEVGLAEIAGQSVNCIRIINDFKDTKEASLFNKKAFDEQNYSKESLINQIQEFGVVGLGGATFPTFTKLNTSQKIDHLIINGAECEPYITADYRLMAEHSSELVTTIKMIKKILNIKNAYIGTEYSQTKETDLLWKLSKQESIQIKKLKALYPQGAEKILIKEVIGQEVPKGKIPADIGCLVLNISTIYALYKAWMHQEPLISRVITISGPAIQTPKNLLVRVGTPIESIIEDCDGFSVIPDIILRGGPMMGKTVHSLSEPVTKGTNGLIVLGEEKSSTRELACIKCSSCVIKCPIGLQPILISKHYRKGNLEELKELEVLDCIECGCCNYVCPSRINLLGDIQAAKKLLREKG